MSYGPSRDPGLSGKRIRRVNFTKNVNSPDEFAGYMYFRSVLMVSDTSQV